MAQYICTECGYEGKGKITLRGSKGVEWFLWLVLLIPGPFYSIWRRMGLKRQCANCGKFSVVNVKSDEGWIAQKKLDMELGVLKPEEPEAAATALTVENETPRVKQTNIDPNAW